jgi:hypothetical protein
VPRRRSERPEAGHTPAPKQTPTTLHPMLARQQLYFFISSAYNQVVDQAKRNGRVGADGSVPAKDAIEFCQLMAPAAQTFAAAIAAGPWPPSAQDEADALTKASAAQAGEYFLCAAAPNGAPCSTR